MSLRTIFKGRVRDVLFSRLRGKQLRLWDTAQVVDFTDAVLKNKAVEIDNYLNERNVTLDNINSAVQEVVDKILLPSIKL